MPTRRMLEVRGEGEVKIMLQTGPVSRQCRGMVSE
jgi:hypothetical protein